MTTSIFTDSALMLKQSKDSITLKPRGIYSGTELNNERMTKLILTYMALVMEQQNEERRTL